MSGPSQHAHGPERSAPLASTGVTGLDAILGGGLPSRRLYLVDGSPGTGKTTLALQLLLAGVARGETGLYVTLSETREELGEVAVSHGWTLDGIDVFELPSEDIDATREAYTLFHPAEVELQEVIDRMFAAVERSGARLVVLDSLSEMRLLARDPLRFRRQILALKQFFSDARLHGAAPRRQDRARRRPAAPQPRARRARSSSTSRSSTGRSAGGCRS